MSYDAAAMNLNIPEKLYVGVQGCKDFNRQDPPLAFAIPYGTDKKFESAKSTVHSWAGYGRQVTIYKTNPDGTCQYDENRRAIIDRVETNPAEGFVIDNELLDGFYFDKHVSRWQTSNKFFRISDPRGFQLEIDCENLGDILLNCAISNGYIVGKFQWTRYKGKAYLVRENHPARERKVNPKVNRKQKALVVGDVVQFSTDTGQWIYAGKVHAIGFSHLLTRFEHISGITTPAKPQQGSSQYWNNYNDRYAVNGDLNENNYRKVLVAGYQKQDKSFNLFFPYGKHVNKYNKNLEWKRNPKLMRSQGTFDLIEEGKEVPNIEYGKPLSFDTICSSYHVSYYILYKDKKELNAVDCSKIDFNAYAEQLNPYVPERQYIHTIGANGISFREERIADRPPTLEPREIPNTDNYYVHF
jgi:hypothetical protein